MDNDNKNKRENIRKDFFKDFAEKNVLSCYQKLEEMLKLYNKEEKDTLEYCIDLYNLAYVQQMLGKFSISTKYYKRILKVLQKDFGDIENTENVNINDKNHILKVKFIIDIQNSLGVCYSKSYVNQKLALDSFKKALSIHNKYIKECDNLKLDILHNIACAFYDRKEYEEAIYNFLEEISFRKEKNIDFIDNLNFLGYCYEKLEKYDKAVGYFNEALEIIKGLSGINSEEYISNIYYISSVYSNMGSYDLAIKSYEKACSLIEQRLGSKHPYYADALSKFSECYLKSDKIEDALKLQLKSLTIVKEAVGEKHMFYATSLKKVADIYYILEDFEKCLTYYEIENKIKEEIIGIYNEEYVTSLLNLINVYIKNKNFEKSEELSQKILKMVDFDLPKKSYERAILILCKIYINNNLSDNLYKIYENYKYIDDKDTFDDMLKKSMEIDEDIINKDKKLNSLFNKDNYEKVDEELEEDIFEGIKNLFDGIKKEIDNQDNEVKEDNNKDINVDKYDDINIYSDEDVDIDENNENI